MAVSSASAAVPSAATAAASTATTKATIADNFQSFLHLLTTQLKNQNPLEPLDTNQFTQQLVQFAQVEQQINMNTSLNTMIAMQKATQTSAALGFLGSTVTVSGDTAKMTNGQAQWSFTGARPATASISIISPTGETAYTGTFGVDAGEQSFSWDGRGNDGKRWPDGNYKMSIAAKDSTGQNVSISTEVSGVVDGVDVTQDPPVLSIGTHNFTADQVKRVRRSTT
jgi:flagellar basal-body rod modification protein FlgD